MKIAKTANIAAVKMKPLVITPLMVVIGPDLPFKALASIAKMIKPTTRV